MKRAAGAAVAVTAHHPFYFHSLTLCVSQRCWKSRTLLGPEKQGPLFPRVGLSSELLISSDRALYIRKGYNYPREGEGVALNILPGASLSSSISFSHSLLRCLSLFALTLAFPDSGATKINMIHIRTKSSNRSRRTQGNERRLGRVLNPRWPKRLERKVTSAILRQNLHKFSSFFSAPFSHRPF